MKKDDSSKHFVAALTGIFASILTTMLWFCFDDKLSEIVGAPWVGSLHWYHVLPFVMFWCSVRPFVVSNQRSDA